MEKLNELTKKQKEEDKLLEAKVFDKIKQSKNRNQFSHTDFLDLSQQELVKKIMTIHHFDHGKLFGGYEGAERRMLIIFPQMIQEYIDEDSYYKKIVKGIRILLPKELYGTYEHRNYLGALMKLGIKREKIGDILIREDGADIIISIEIEKFLLENLKTLTRFQKAKISSISISEVMVAPTKKEQFTINVPSMRLDCIVGELARCSRSSALALIQQERVFVNFKEELSQGKQISENTYITIRGKGRFRIVKIEGTTRSGRLNILIEK